MHKEDDGKWEGDKYNSNDELTREMTMRTTMQMRGTPIAAAMPTQANETMKTMRMATKTKMTTSTPLPLWGATACWVDWDICMQMRSCIDVMCLSTPASSLRT